MDSEPQEPHLGCKPGDGVRWSAFAFLSDRGVKDTLLFKQVKVVVKLDVEE